MYNGTVMPRTVLEPRFQVEYLSILDSDGNLDSSLEPEIAQADLKRMYRGMLLGRRLDERMIRLQRQGRIGTFAPIKGQEASQIGSVLTLRRSDWMVPSFRETASMLSRGWPIEKLLKFFAGYLEGGQPGGGGPRARGQRAHADRVRHLSPRRPHHGRRSDEVPLHRGSRRVGAQGSPHALHRLPQEEAAARGRAGRGGRRRDRRRHPALRGDGRRRAADDVRARLRRAAAAPPGPARAGRRLAARGRERRRDDGGSA